VTGLTVVSVSVTEAGGRLAEQLPFQHRQGELGKTVRGLWGEVEGFVLVCAVGIAVRVVGPLLGDKGRDPVVVCVDDGGRWVVALAGGHRGAHELAREVAGLVGGEAVVTTATDGREDVPALDALAGFAASGDVAGVTRAWLDGEAPVVDRGDLPGWPLPPALDQLASGGDGDGRPRPLVRVTDRRVISPSPTGSASAPADGVGADAGAVDRREGADVGGGGVVVLRPGSLVVGVGASSGAEPAGVVELVEGALGEAGLAGEAVGVVASVDLKRGEPGVVAVAERFGVELRTFPAEVLAQVDVPNPSSVVAAAVGTGSVAEAAALLAAGDGAELVVDKRRSGEATVAVARRVRPEGHVAVVGLGPGDPGWRVPAAATAVRHAEVVIGYGPYVDLAGDLVSSQQEVVRSPIGAEVERCTEALVRAGRGQRVALVCSGDAGVFALASLVCELAPVHGDPPVTVVPGVTAASGAAAVLGAPLGHDHAALSLSDLLTPWDVIERRLLAVAEGDLVVSLYNPRSQRRTWQLARAAEILAPARPPGCPVAVVTDVGRLGQTVVRTTLEDFRPGAPAFDAVGMLSLVVVGATSTCWIGDRMVTPRGYSHPVDPAKARAQPEAAGDVEVGP
jgi:cobalt-precorrin 5A hydrolase / precorrin-3B C17-methyltransferase